MTRIILGLLALAACLSAPAARSAEIAVPPGDGTLAAAIAAADPGDTLVLRDGTFTGDAVVDKSLTLRPVNRGTFAVMTGTLSINGAGIRVTVQGLKFTQNLLIAGAGAESVRVLENDFAAGNLLIYGSVGAATGDSEPPLVVVGNRFAEGMILEDRQRVLAGLYVAGNTLVGGGVGLWSGGWLVGNQFHIPGPRSGGLDSAIRVWQVHAHVRIFANRIIISAGNQPWVGSVRAAISVESPYVFIAGNIIEISGNPRELSSVIFLITSYGVILNNVIRSSWSYPLTVGALVIESQSSFARIRISGNIILDFPSSRDTLIGANGSFQDVSHNLCYNTGSAACPSGNGNLNADPKFVDLVDYRLAPNSPAINAGPSDYGFADLDRTRNDMGAHGGPWSIGQYDAQRDPNNLTPYVYPLTTSGWLPGSGSSGSVEVQALGVARLR